MKESDTLTIPLTSHEAVVAALVLCAMIGNDNKAVVMALGVSGDFKEHTDIALDDYELEELLEDDEWFCDYPDITLCVSIDALKGNT
jgi:hypothetical protein